jgi:hypothetical protein
MAKIELSRIKITISFTPKVIGSGFKVQRLESTDTFVIYNIIHRLASFTRWVNHARCPY